ncbi:flavoprotein [Streptomyces sp. G44]|uniref:flavoprotein n=1 Tax=Streptomyces sp. G44 TaxID=2807632 RepID=UPI001961DE01|nr:flavoprotein [Streptomyces sp. G44]MBM7167707.1 flavoprotein [Streptomyces sp. G44]
MTTATTQPSIPTEPPPFTARRLLYIASGGVQAMFLPMWLGWLRSSYPDTEIRCVVTRSALRFATPTAISAAGGTGLPMVDTWPDEPDGALHVELAQWPDAVLVHPATLSFVTRLSLGIADTPALLALQCTKAPIVLCPALPPGGNENPAYRRNVAELSQRDNITVLPPIPGISMSTGQAGIGTAALLPHAIAALEEARLWTEYSA